MLARNSRYFVSSGSTNEDSSGSHGDVSLNDEHDFDEWYRRSRSFTIQDSNKSEFKKIFEESYVSKKI